MNTYRSKNAELMYMQLLEQPQLNILGRSPSNEHQFLYEEERINIINSKNKLEVEGIYMEDIISVFK